MRPPVWAVKGQTGEGVGVQGEVQDLHQHLEGSGQAGDAAAAHLQAVEMLWHQTGERWDGCECNSFHLDTRACLPSLLLACAVSTPSLVFHGQASGAGPANGDANGLEGAQVRPPVWVVKGQTGEGVGVQGEVQDLRQHLEGSGQAGAARVVAAAQLRCFSTKEESAGMAVSAIVST